MNNPPHSQDQSAKPRFRWLLRLRRGVGRLMRRAGAALRRVKRGHDERLRASSEYRSAARVVVVVAQSAVALLVGVEVAALVAALGLAYICYQSVNLDGLSGAVA